MIRLIDFQREMRESRTSLVLEMATKMNLEKNEYELLQIIIKHTKDDELIDPTTFESDLEKIPMKLWTKEWTETVGALHKKHLVRLGVRLNTDPENTDQENDSEP